MYEGISQKVFDQFLDHILKFMPNYSKPYLVLVPKGVYDTSVFEE